MIVVPVYLSFIHVWLKTKTDGFGLQILSEGFQGPAPLDFGDLWFLKKGHLFTVAVASETNHI